MDPDMSPPPYSPQDPDWSSHNASAPVVQTGQSSVRPSFLHCVASSDPDPVPSLYSASPLPAFRPGTESSLVLVSPPPLTPDPNPTPTTPPSYQVSVIVPSPDLRPSPLPSRCAENPDLDLECSICFSQFNNVFRCPKMLQCKHTFCLECLARINVKAAEPDAIQCPLCRGLTPLPNLGLPRLATNSDLLSCLPAAMQRVYSIRFLRNKGKLQVKRSSEGPWWGPTQLRPANRSLDVGLPSPPARGGAGSSTMGEALFRLTGRPACRAFLLTSVVMMMALLTGIVIFLITYRRETSN